MSYSLRTTHTVAFKIIESGTEPDSYGEVSIAQSQETWISNYLSISLLVGLGANAVVGWWWADPLVALLVAGIAAYSGIEGWREAQERHD